MQDNQSLTSPVGVIKAGLMSTEGRLFNYLLLLQTRSQYSYLYETIGLRISLAVKGFSMSSLKVRDLGSNTAIIAHVNEFSIHIQTVSLDYYEVKTNYEILKQKNMLQISNQEGVPSKFMLGT